MVKFQLEREVAANMSNWEKEFYKKEMEMRPERVKQIIDFVNNDQLIKFSDHIAMTSLIAFLDPIMKAITSELIKAGRIQMQVHKYNITITYHKFRTAYLAVANPYPHIDTVEFLFEQLYSKRGYSGRNAILHLDGIDFNIPYKYSSKISLLLQNIYYYLNDLMVYENIALTELPSSFNQFDDSDVELVVKYQDATNDYFINKSVPQDILAAGDRDQIAKLSLKEMEEARERYKSLMPQFAHLHAISSFSVQVEDSNEALLTISMSAILLEKLLLNFKQSLNMPGNFASSHYSNTLYQCTFKSLELNNPGNSFVNSDLLEKLYEHITGQDHLEDPEDYDAFLSLLKTLEKIRNISAHGGVEQFRPLYREINHFLFFLSFRLV